MQAPTHMMHTPKLPILLLAALLTLALTTQSHAIAPPPQTDTHIKAALQASQSPVPGTQFILALTLDIDEHWHTYWPGINDTGYGISLTFASVAGLTFGQPLFPTPTRHIAPGNILDHIYENQITIFVPVEVDESIAPSDSLTIDTAIDYLICKEVCIPESITTSITLVVTDMDSKRSIRSSFPHSELILLFPPLLLENAVPDDSFLPGTPDKWFENEIQVTIRDAVRYTFFPYTNCTNPADLITQGDTESKSLTITFDRKYEDDPTTPAKLSGRLLVTMNNGWQKQFDVNYTQQTQLETSP